MACSQNHEDAKLYQTDTRLLAVAGLTKIYDGRSVVADLDVSVDSGSALALVGPNGCGKSTVLRCLSGHEQAEYASFQSLGHPVKVNSAIYRRHIFPIFDDFAFFPDLTVREHLEFLGGMFGVSNREEFAISALEMFGMRRVADQFPANLSSGQVRRVAFASAAIRPWNVLLLDEPEQRLDQAGRRLLIDFLLEQLRAGRALIFATHDLDLVQRVNADVLALPVRG